MSILTMPIGARLHICYQVVEPWQMSHKIDPYDCEFGSAKLVIKTKQSLALWEKLSHLGGVPFEMHFECFIGPLSDPLYLDRAVYE